MNITKTFIYCLIIYNSHILCQAQTRISDKHRLDTVDTYSEYKELFKKPNKVYNLYIRGFTGWKLDNDVLKNEIKKIGKLKNLRNLNIYNLYFSQCPDELFTLRKIEYLTLRASDVRNLSSKIGKLKKLKELKLDECGMSTLPLSIKKLSNLEILDLSNNQFKKLPLEVVNLKKLKELYFTENYIENISLKEIEEMGKMKSHLKYLDITGLIIDKNMIEELQKALPNTEIINTKMIIEFRR